MKILVTEKMKELRTKNGWSLEKMAKKIGLDYRTLKRYEEGFASPSAETVASYMEIFKVSVEYMYFGNEVSDIELCNKIKHLFPKQKAAILAVLDSYS